MVFGYVILTIGCTGSCSGYTDLYSSYTGLCSDYTGYLVSITGYAGLCSGYTDIYLGYTVVWYGYMFWFFPPKTSKDSFVIYMDLNSSRWQEWMQEPKNKSVAVLGRFIPPEKFRDLKIISG